MDKESREAGMPMDRDLPHNQRPLRLLQVEDSKEDVKLSAGIWSAPGIN
jgi:hypothetical protein